MKIDILKDIVENKSESYGDNIKESVIKIRKIADKLWSDFEEGNFESVLIMADGIKATIGKLERDLKSYESSGSN